MIQKIKVNQRDPPALHKKMVKCLNKYGLSFEVVQPSTNIQRALPLWHHPGENNQKSQQNNGAKAKCLRNNHTGMTIGDGLDLVKRLDDPMHDDHNPCECVACEEDRMARGCDNPHACIKAAKSRLGQILPKWIPADGEAEETNPEEIPASPGEDDGLFQPPKSITSLAQGLRVMTRRTGKPVEREDPPVRCRRAAAEPIPEATEIYIAGVVHAPSSRQASAAAGIFLNIEDDRNKGKCIPITEAQSQYGAELFAALEAVKTTNRNTMLTITSTQDYVRDAMNKKLSNWEHKGWVGVPHSEVLRCLAAELKARKAPTIFKVAVPGSVERARCKQAATLAKRAARDRREGQWELTLPPNTALPGLSLQGNRQRVFYRSIREVKTRVKATTPRPSTSRMLDMVRKAAEDAFSKYATDEEIWKSLTTKDILPRTSQFLWKGIHNAHRIGRYWDHIPECEERAVCANCDDVVEDLDHILLKCKCPGQELVWRAAETLWKEKEEVWPEVSLGTILGCGLAEFRDDKGKVKAGTQRLYRILMSESAYVIWKLRNDRRIARNGAPATEQEILNKWKFAINQRLQVDITLANRPRKGKRPALAPEMVLTTWSGTLDNEHDLPANWLREPRVLVGNRAFSQTHSRRRNGRGIG
jgi:ribonuclease HI